MGMKARPARKRHATPADYIAAVAEGRREDIQHLHDMVREEAPALEPTMAYGMLGYGSYHYKYASGREGDWLRIGIASNNQYISIYCCAADENGYVADGFRARLPKANIGKSCVRFKRLADVDEAVLRELIRKTAQTSAAM